MKTTPILIDFFHNRRAPIYALIISNLELEQREIFNQLVKLFRISKYSLHVTFRQLDTISIVSYYGTTNIKQDNMSPESYSQYFLNNMAVPELTIKLLCI